MKSPYRSPDAAAVPKAQRSAQTPTGYDAFSTFTPETYDPRDDFVESFTSSVAPTRNLEYGPGAMLSSCGLVGFVRVMWVVCFEAGDLQYARDLASMHFSERFVTSSAVRPCTCVEDEAAMLCCLLVVFVCPISGLGFVVCDLTCILGCFPPQRRTISNRRARVSLFCQVFCELLMRID